MNRLPAAKQVQVIAALCEGSSIRSTERMTGVHRDTIMRLLVTVGNRCDGIMAETMRGLECKDLQLDEIWTFCHTKQRRLKPEDAYNSNKGDQWVFYAVDRDSKVIPAWYVGKRDAAAALGFMRRLKGSLNGVHPQLSADAWDGYPEAIDRVFGLDCTFGIVSKTYESVHVGPGRYAPPRVSGIIKADVIGAPNRDRICTSHIERSNLTIRTMQRRFTRLALGFSRKLENLRAAVALHFAYYNLVWCPRTLGGGTPAMAAGATKRLWTVADLVAS